MKNLKKLLSVIVVVAMLVTMMIPAFAEETTAKTDVEICQALNVLKGEGDGLTDEYLASQPTRKQAAMMFLRLKGLEEEALAFNGTENFADAKDADAYWTPVLAYLYANQDLGFEGVGDSKFDPNGLMTAKAYYKVMLVALGYEYNSDFEWANVNSFAASKGLTKNLDVAAFTVNDLAAATVEALQATVNGTEATLIAKLVEDGAVAVEDAEASGIYTAPVETLPEVESVTAISAKALKVTFTKAIDTTGVTFSIKRGSTVVVLTAAFSDDKTSATLTSTIKLVAGDYTVTVNGANLEEGKNVGTVKVEAEKETALNILTETVSIADTSKVAFEVKNQYGEVMNVTSSSAGLVSTAYDKTPKADGTGTGSITLTPVAGKAEFTGNFASALTVVDGDEILVTISYKGLSAVKTVIAKAVATLTSFELVAPSPIAGKTRITAGETIELPYNAVDQYGAAYKLPAYIANTDAVNDQETIGDWLFTSSNTAVVDVDSLTIDTNGKFTFVAAGAGTTKIIAVNKKTGGITTADVEVFAAAAADSISLTAPSALVVAGEKVKVPYSVFDQFGAEVSKSSLNTGSVTLASSDNAKATVAWTGSKEIEITGVGAGTCEISATIGTKVAKFSVDVQAAAEATTINGVKDVPVYFESTATANMKFANILVKDQYGRDYSLKDGDVVTVAAKDGTADMVTMAKNDPAFDNTNDVVTFTGTANADKSDVFTLTLANGASCEITLTSVASSKITSYEIKPIATIYANAANDKTVAHAATVTVVGKAADGKEVALVATKVTLLTTTNSVVGVDTATKKVFATDAGTATIKAFSNGTFLAETTVTAIKDAPVATTLTFAAAEKTVSVTAGTTTNALTAKDQYGVAYTLSGGGYYSSNASVATVAADGTVTLSAVGEATISYVSSNGVVVSYRLIVNN